MVMAYTAVNNDQLYSLLYATIGRITLRTAIATHRKSIVYSRNGRSDDLHQISRIILEKSIISSWDNCHP
jgi:hypothetical protein